MPFKSQAQRRKFAQLLVEGKISNQTFEEWNRETGVMKLPERVARKAAPRSRDACSMTRANRWSTLVSWRCKVLRSSAQGARLGVEIIVRSPAR
jgi:hypothetical protein